MVLCMGVFFLLLKTTLFLSSYQAEVRRREKLGLSADDIVVEVKGAEKPRWTDLWIIRLVLLPHSIYVWWKERPERLRKAEAERLEWEAKLAAMTNAEKKATFMKAWRMRNR